MHQLELLEQRIGFEHLLLFFGLEVEHGRKQIAEAQRIVDAGHQLPHFGSETGRERESTLDQFLDPPYVGVDFDTAIHRLGGGRDRGAEDAVFDGQPFHSGARHALDDDVD